MFVSVGTYTESPMGSAEGVYVFHFDEVSGVLSPVQTVAGITNPSFLASSRDGRRFFAVNELGEGKVTAFARDPGTGRLTKLNSQLAHGADPCCITLDPSERFALIANYTSGTVAVLPIASDGRLEPAASVVTHHGSSINPARQSEPHAHMMAPTPDGRYVLATDLGMDRIVVYRLDPATGSLTESNEGLRTTKTPPGFGPRHFAFAPDSRTLYVIGELDATIAVYGYDGKSLTLKQTVSTLPSDFAGERSCAQILVSPEGRFVYGSNRGHDSIAIFAVDPATGELTAAGHQLTLGKTPRNFNIDPSGAWLLAANQESSTIVVFRRDAESGQLTQTGDPISVPAPVAILFG